MDNEAPPPPPNNTQEHAWSTLPAGWATAISPEDGRIYYWEKETGRTSWVHPDAIGQVQGALPSPRDPPANGDYLHQNSPRSSPRSLWVDGTRTLWNWNRGSSRAVVHPQNPPQSYPHNTMRTEFLDTPWNASRRPESHQCYAVTALILCFPIGVCAVIHSFAVDRAWDDGRYGDAVNHSRQAQNYSCFGTGLGCCFWLYWFFFHDGRRMFDWMDFNFD